MWMSISVNIFAFYMIRYGSICKDWNSANNASWIFMPSISVDICVCVHICAYLCISDSTQIWLSELQSWLLNGKCNLNAQCMQFQVEGFVFSNPLRITLCKMQLPSQAAAWRWWHGLSLWARPWSSWCNLKPWTWTMLLGVWQSTARRHLCTLSWLASRWPVRPAQWIKTWLFWRVVSAACACSLACTNETSRCGSTVTRGASSSSLQLAS